MLQKVLKVGSSAAVVIPKKSLKELGIEPGERVQVTVDEREGTMTVRAQCGGVGGPGKRRDRIARLTLNFIDRYRSDLEALAKK